MSEWEQCIELTEEGDRHFVAKEFIQARECYESAIELLRMLEKGFGRQKDRLRIYMVNRDLAVPLSRLARLLCDQDKPQEAAAVWEEVVQRLERAEHTPSEDVKIKDLLEHARSRLTAYRDLALRKEALDGLAVSMDPNAWRAAQLFADRIAGIKRDNVKDWVALLLDSCWRALFPEDPFDPEGDPDFASKDADFRLFCEQHQHAIVNALTPIMEYHLNKLKLETD